MTKLRVVGAVFVIAVLAGASGLVLFVVAPCAFDLAPDGGGPPLTTSQAAIVARSVDARFLVRGPIGFSDAIAAARSGARDFVPLAGWIAARISHSSTTVARDAFWIDHCVERTAALGLAANLIEFPKGLVGLGAGATAVFARDLASLTDDEVATLVAVSSASQAPVELRLSDGWIEARASFLLGRQVDAEVASKVIQYFRGDV